jgi:hypothetical protein
MSSQRKEDAFDKLMAQVEEDDAKGKLEAEVQCVSHRYGLHEDDDRDEILFHIAESFYDNFVNI